MVKKMIIKRNSMTFSKTFLLTLCNVQQPRYRTPSRTLPKLRSTAQSEKGRPDRYLIIIQEDQKNQQNTETASSFLEETIYIPGKN